jgi:hypothetical protein
MENNISFQKIPPNKQKPKPSSFNMEQYSDKYCRDFAEYQSGTLLCFELK